MTPQTTDSVTLTEHTALADVHLTSVQACALAQFRFTAPTDGSPRASRLLEVGPGSATGLYNLRASNIVGTASIAGVQVNVLPKAGVGKTAQMLAHSVGLARFLRDTAAFADAGSFSALLVPAFLSQAAEVVGEGLVEDYVATVEMGMRPRGRVNFQASARFGLPSPVEYDYDDFVADTPFNQLLLRALHAVGDMATVSPDSHARARFLMGAFAGVSFVDWPALYHGERLPERVAHYQEAITIATLILEGIGVEPISSRRVARGLLFDMNRVFEGFITALLRRNLPHGLNVDVQGTAHPMYLDAHRRYRLRPDFSIWDRYRCRVVGDLKYKTLDAQNGPRRPDLYQMASYAAAAGTSRALLIYVGANEGTNVEIVFPEVTIEVRAVDLGQDIDSIEAQVHNIIAAV